MTLPLPCVGADTVRPRLQAAPRDGRRAHNVRPYSLMLSRP